MAATINTWYGYDPATKNPMTFTSYNVANGAVGVFEEVKIIGEAGTTDDKILTLPTNMMVTDLIAGCATGKLRIESNGLDTQTVIDLASHQPTSAGRPALSIPLGMNKRYRVKIEATLPA